MDPKDVRADPSTIYWCAEYQSYCNVLGFCEWDKTCIIIELHDDEGTTGELRTTESDKLWADPISRLKHRGELEHFHHARMITIEGRIGEDKINEVMPEHTWEHEPEMEAFNVIAFEYNRRIGQIVADATKLALHDHDKHKLNGEIDDIDFSLTISCAYDEPSFTHTGCEACSPNTGNSVMGCVGINMEGDKFQYDICENCLYIHQYGWN